MDAKDINVNVYNKISRGEHICKGDRLYSREEMKEMLADSGLSIEEIRMLYELNAEAALEEISEMTNDFLEAKPEEKIVLSRRGGTTFESFFGLLRTRFIMIAAICLQALVAGFVGFWWLSDYDFLKYLPVLLVVVSYLFAALIVSGFRSYIRNIARDMIWPAEIYGNDKMKKILEDRFEVMNSICNTFHMYEAMDDRLHEDSGPLFELPFIDADDDLK